MTKPAASLRAIAQTTLFWLGVILAGGVAWTAGGAASLAQSDDLLRLLLIGVPSSVAAAVAYCFRRRRLAWALWIIAVGTPLFMGLSSRWQLRARPEQAVSAQFADFALHVPAGAACFSSTGYSEGGGRDARAHLQLRSPRASRCPELGNGVDVNMSQAHEPPRVIGEVGEVQPASHLAPIAVATLPLSGEERGKFASGLNNGSLIPLSRAIPTGWYACDPICYGVLRHRSSLVSVTWSVADVPDEPDKVLQYVAAKLRAWTY